MDYLGRQSWRRGVGTSDKLDKIQLGSAPSSLTAAARWDGFKADSNALPQSVIR